MNGFRGCRVEESPEAAGWISKVWVGGQSGKVILTMGILTANSESRKWAEYFWLLKEPGWPELMRRIYYILDITRLNGIVFRWCTLLLIYHSYLFEGQRSCSVWMSLWEDINNTFKK